MATEQKEVVFHADSVQVEQQRQHSRQAFLNGCSGGDEAAIKQRVSRVRRWEHGAVHLAARIQRQGFQLHECRRNHVLWQSSGNEIAQFRMRRLGLSSGHEISNEALVARFDLTRHYSACLHGRVFVEHFYDFRRLDPEASNLNLVVNSTEKRHLAIWEIMAQVTCPEETRACFGTEGVGNKSLCG